MGKYHKKLASSISLDKNRSRSESINRSHKSILKCHKTQASLNSISSFKLCQSGHNHYPRASRITKLNKKSKDERSKKSEERSRRNCGNSDRLKKELQRISISLNEGKKNSLKTKRDKKKKIIDYSTFLQLDQEKKQRSTKKASERSSKPNKDIQARLKRSNSQYVKLLRLKKCEICKKKGQDQMKNIVYCSVCDDAYHRKCLSSPLTLKQAKNLDEWLCEDCLQQFQSQQSSNCDVDILENKVSQSLTLDQMFYINTCQEVNPLIFLPKKEWTKRQNQCFKLQAFTPIKKKQLHWSNLLKALSSTGHTFSNYQVYINDQFVEYNRSILHKPSVCQMLSCPDEKAFQQFLQLTEKGQAPPLSVQKCPIKGYMVRALSAIQPKTIICEYAGEVMTYRDSLKIHDNDSIFKLLQTGSSRTSLDIVPHKYANVSKYFLGINNDFHDNYQKVNVQALIFSYKGRNRVIFYTIKDVKKGDLLFIDYNSGIGNHYPTESFL